jgi:tetratricopeptide (TPR) repeat protein
LDSTYAPAHASIAANYILLVPKALQPKEGYSKAKTAALKAIELNPRLSEAYSSMAMVKLIFERDWAEAEREFQQALRLDPENALARTWYAQFLMAANRLPEATEQIKIACKIAPNSVHAQATAGEIFWRTEQNDEAMQAYQKVVKLEPNHIPAHNGLANIYRKKLLFEQASSEYQKVLEIMGEPSAATLARTFAYAEKTEPKVLLSKLDIVLKHKNTAPSQIARIFAGFNDRDKAFYWLEKGYEEWDAGLMLLKIDDSWDNLREDPRFASLMQRVGIIN